MRAEELEDGLRWLWQKYYSKPSIKKRLSRWMMQPQETAANNALPNTTAVLMGLNMAFKVAVEEF